MSIMATVQATSKTPTYPCCHAGDLSQNVIKLCCNIMSDCCRRFHLHWLQPGTSEAMHSRMHWSCCWTCWSMWTTQATSMTLTTSWLLPWTPLAGCTLMTLRWNNIFVSWPPNTCRIFSICAVHRLHSLCNCDTQDSRLMDAMPLTYLSASMSVWL